MSRRIDVELTSARADGSWTWRAAGAREPKGVVEGAVVPRSAKVGDVLRVEADIDVDGITIVNVLPAKGTRREPERIELLGGGDFEPVTSTLVAKRERRERDRDRPPRRDRPADGERPRRDRPTDRGRERPAGRGRDRVEPARDDAAAPAAAGDTRARRPPRERPARPSKPAPIPKPKPARLRPGRAHRSELVRSLPAEHQPIAEQALRGGLPAVRQALEEQNAKLRAEDKPEIKSDGIVSIAEEILPQLRVAEWLDRAEAARADIDHLDLGDLRSVVVASDDAAVARDESTRALAAELKEALGRRQEEAHREWLAELTSSLDDGRAVRALRLSSRPPKAGAVFPPELRARLTEAAAASLTADASADRWVAVLEALAYSPVRSQVTVEQPPGNITEELRSTITRLASLLPDIARAFGIEPPPPGTRPPRPPRRGGDQRRGPKPGAKPPPPPPRADRGASRPAAQVPAGPSAGSAAATEPTVADTDAPPTEATGTEATQADMVPPTPSAPDPQVPTAPAVRPADSASDAASLTALPARADAADTSPADTSTRLADPAPDTQVATAPDAATADSAPDAQVSAAPEAPPTDSTPDAQVSTAPEAPPTDSTSDTQVSTAPDVPPADPTADARATATADAPPAGGPNAPPVDDASPAPEAPPTDSTPDTQVSAAPEAPPTDSTPDTQVSAAPDVPPADPTADTQATATADAPPAGGPDAPPVDDTSPAPRDEGAVPLGANGTAVPDANEKAAAEPSTIERSATDSRETAPGAGTPTSGEAGSGLDEISSEA